MKCTVTQAKERGRCCQAALPHGHESGELAGDSTRHRWNPNSVILGKSYNHKASVSSYIKWEK